MSHMMLISDAAKAVNVENHVLRYWEEELHLPIKRNELGHRYYTEEDVERFKQIKSMKERGLQLKAIKMILRDGKIDVLPSDEDVEASQGQAWESDKPRNDSRTPENDKPRNDSRTPEGGRTRDDSRAQENSGHGEQNDAPHMAIEIVERNPSSDEASSTTAVEAGMQDAALSKEEKSKRLQWLLQQLIRETLVENNEQLCNDIKESVVKELDYQFRLQEERDEERTRQEAERSEEYYRKMDELLRGKVSGRKQARTDKSDKTDKTDKIDNGFRSQSQGMTDKQKKKRHFIF